MQGDLADGPFTVDDFDAIADLVLDALGSALDRDWSVAAGTLEWSCWTTAEHTVDCVFSYALFLASRKQDDYPRLGELHAEPGATPADLLDGLRAVSTMLSSVIRTAPADARAIIWARDGGQVAGPQHFAARGAHELLLHAHDLCAGLDVAFDPPQDLCQRLWEHTEPWGVYGDNDPTGDPWHDLLVRSGRTRPST